MKFLFLFLFFTNISFAQHSISSQNFQVNVRPVLSGILNDFYQMIVLFPDVPRDLVEIIEDIDHLSDQKDALLKECPRLLEKKCLPQIDGLRKKLKAMSIDTFSLLKHQNISSSLYLTNIAGLRVISDFQESLESLQGKLDNAAFALKADVNPRQETYPFIKQVDELGTYASLALVEFIPFTYKEDFRHFFFSFVQPIQIQLGKSISYEFMNRNVTSLNFAINLLNQSLTKRNKKTPEGMGPYLATIHNRWNSILRYYF
jgi:hypothetical protein